MIFTFPPTVYEQHIPINAQTKWKSTAMPVTGPDGLQGWEMPRIPYVLGNRPQMVVRSSALHIDSILPSQNDFLIFISVKGWVNSRTMVQLEGLGKFKKFNNLIRTEPTAFLFLAQCLNYAVLCPL
jgi:hypothetical protein